MTHLQGLDLNRLREDYVGAIIISAIPLPPSDNAQYKTVVRRDTKARNGYKTLRVKSDSAQKYKKQFSDWALVNAQSLVKARKAVASWEGTIELQLYFAMEVHRLFTLDKRIKKNDATNRDKNLQDCLAASLLIDDSRFKLVRLEQVISAPNSEQVLAILKPKKVRTLAEVYKGLESDVI